MTSRHSPLDAEHRALGARMTDFAGWEMPLSYADGTLAEHRACRERAVAFDVSHLGTVRVTGPEAFAASRSSLAARRGGAAVAAVAHRYTVQSP